MSKAEALQQAKKLSNNKMLIEAFEEFEKDTVLRWDAAKTLNEREEIAMHRRGVNHFKSLLNQRIAEALKDGNDQ